jgi:hypothetical protein
MNNLTRFLRTKNSARSCLAGLILGICAASVTAQEAEYYTWVDENGVTNYAERNPEGINATFVGRGRAFGRPGSLFESGEPAGAVPAVTESGEEATAIDPDLLVEESAAALAAQLAEQKRANCEAGKNNLAQLRAFARIRVSDELGENRILTDEEKAERTEQARQVIRDNCSG